MGSRVIKNRRGTKRKNPVIGLVYVLAFFAVALVAGAFGLYFVGQSWLQDLPDYQDTSAYNLSQKTRVYASDGTTLLAEFFTEDRDPVTVDKISQYVLDGTVATEDVRFYEHGGIDPQGIMRAVFVNVFGIDTEGASTITQQLVRNTVLASEASESTLKRKVREAYIAIKMEQMYSKDEILLMYLNTINYGSGVYGIQAAAQKYYSKDAKDLTLAEAAALVGIPQSPTNNNPIDHPEACLARRNVVLDRMLTNGFITQAQYDQAVAQPLGLKVRSASSSNDGIYAYPYFTSYVRDTLLNMYSTDTVFKGGLTVYTTLDVNLQNEAETAAKNKESGMADDLEVAMSVVDPKTGYVKAIVGGKDYYTDQYNLATQATRQPGSSFKTFTLVGCIENGLNPTTTYVNCPSTITLDNWTVSNIDNINYGTRTVASAFEVSSNTGFARLCTWLGPLKVVDVAKRMGITSSLYAVPSITLGTQGVTTLEMADAYATLASGGTHHDATCINRVVDSDGETIYKSDTTGNQVLSAETTYAATKVMQGVITNGTGTEAALSNGQPAAGKTGTSESYRDSWFCGFTPQYSVAVWLGAREERTISSSITASSVFSDFLNMALSGQAVQQFATAADPAYTAVNDSDLGISSSYSSASGASTTSSSTNASTTATTATTATTTQ